MINMSVGLSSMESFMANASDKSTILLETINPADLTIDELWQLADDLNAKIIELMFVPAYEEQHGAGVTWHEVIRLWVENREVFEGAAFEAAFSQVIEAMRGRFKKKHHERRPKSIIVNDKSTGNEIKSVALENVESEPIEVEVDVNVKVRVRPVPPQQKRPND
jgi:hypothetical protein